MERRPLSALLSQGIQLLLKYGGNPNDSNDVNDETLTASCIRHDHSKTLQGLLDGGADVNLGARVSKRFPSQPLVVSAASRGSQRCLRLLLERKVCATACWGLRPDDEAHHREIPTRWATATRR